MELSELDEWADEFEAFHSQFSPLFGRRIESNCILMNDKKTFGK